MDISLFHLINNIAGQTSWLDTVMVFSAKFLPAMVLIVLIMLWLSRRAVQQRAVLLASISTIISLGFAQIFGFFYPRSRPFLTIPANLLIARTTDTSFPSDHAVFSFAIAVMIWRYNRKAGTLLLAMATLISVARIYVGTHYPTDVIGGALLGFLISYTIDKLTTKKWAQLLINRIIGVLHQWNLAARPQ